MRFDDVIKRSFVVIVCFLIGAAAYFQASGLMSLARATLAEGAPFAEGTPGALGGGQEKLPAGRDRDLSAAAILARNPFDSKTGPLDGSGAPLPGPPVGAEEDDGAPCEGVRVVLITAADDPEWSFAAIAEGAEKPILRRLGDAIAGYAVEAIARDRVRLASGVRSCMAELGAVVAAKGPTKVTEKPAKLGREGGAAPGALPPDIASKIRKTGERELEVDRSVIADVMERQREIVGSVRVAPSKDGGLRLMGIRPGSLLGTLGMENGDTLRSINGFDLSDPKSALEAYARLQQADRLTVSVERRGQPMNIDVKIK
jgi:general secretion pathway protein C